MSGRTVDPAATPTLINLPPPPADPHTPSDLPGTPNSATTSMSELSTVAIKDGHRGHLPHHYHSGQPMEAERADRISRLAGFDRVAQPSRTLTPSNAGSVTNPTHPPTTQGYFDANNNPQIMRERSTVGSASATGSVGGRTTWASESDVNFADDKDSETMDVDGERAGGFSDEAASLVGFGEGARTPARQLSGVGSPTPGAAGKVSSALPPGVRQGQPHAPSPMSGVQSADPRLIDGMTRDRGVLDTTDRSPPLVTERQQDLEPQFPERHTRNTGSSS